MSSVTTTAVSEFTALQSVQSYALISVDSYRLLLPQGDIALLELSSELDHLPVADQYNVALLNFQGELWPTYCLGGDFTLRTSIPPSRYICAVLNDDKKYLGLLCDTIDNLAAAAFRLHPIPLCMQQDNMLAAALAIRDDDALVITTVVRLHRFIRQHQQEQTVEQQND